MTEIEQAISKTATVMSQLFNLSTHNKPAPIKMEMSPKRCVEFFVSRLNLDGLEVYSAEIEEFAAQLPASEVVVMIDGNGMVDLVPRTHPDYLSTVSSTTASISCLVFPLYDTSWVVVSTDFGESVLIPLT
jgi:hypothetical protein